jgi:carbon-monoxide dehydrogenase small subunit
VPERYALHFWVNGEEQWLEVLAHRLLLDVLREDLKLKGTKRACDIGVCGACTVLVDDRSVSACLMLALRVDGSQVLTVEGLAVDGRLHPLQQGFLDLWGFQCGYCTPGMLLTAVELLEKDPMPSPATVREALTGNLCRCTGYLKIVESILAGAAELQRRPGSLPDADGGVAHEPCGPRRGRAGVAEAPEQ